MGKKEGGMKKDKDGGIGYTKTMSSQSFESLDLAVG